MPNPHDAFSLVEGDTGAGLGDLLPAGDEQLEWGFQSLEGFETTRDRPIADIVPGDERGDATMVAVPWQWTGVHRGELLGIAPTDRILRVRGVTLVKDTDDGPELHRYVDWATTLQELGVRFYDRPVVDVRKRFGDAMLEIDVFRAAVEESL